MALMRFDGIAATLAWLVRRGATGLCSDSRQLQPGDAFIAWPGHVQDGRRHVAAALAAGAPACLIEADGAEAFDFGDDPRIAAVAGLKAATGELAAAFYGHPSDGLPVLAVTGTNGKTSTAWWIAQALTALGQRCGVVGTLGIGTPPDVVATGLTTPDPVRLQAAFHRLAHDGCRAVAIEASSIGIEEQRLAGSRIAVALLTNFTQDHLDYHGSMAVYWQAKARLFAWTGLKSAVVNLHDQQGAELAQQLAGGSSPELWTYSVGGPARLTARSVAYHDGGLGFDVCEADEVLQVRTRLIGDYNVANLLAVIGGLRAIGVALADAAGACALLTPVPGRMQRIDVKAGGVTLPQGVGADAALPQGVVANATLPQVVVANAALPQVVVDYAHTPDALEKALRALLPLADARGGVLWCVFGCGGNRDAGKRPLMGGIAERLSGRVVVTSDNPRHEAPSAILADIVAGLQVPANASVIEDRRAAIVHAVDAAEPADVVLVAGKGHEDYQDIGGVKLAFSDVEVAAQALAVRAGLLPLSKGERKEDSPLAMKLKLALAHLLLPGSTLIGDGAVSFNRVHSDTRSLRPGDLFVALRGERFDAHDFLPQARAAGAVAALAERGLEAAGLSGLQVADSRQALGALASAWRQRFGLPLIAVTGSNGKTTVTQMVASVLRAWLGDAAFATEGNFNNDIGVPLTLLRLRESHRAGVVELGMNHPGEIALLAAVAAPTVVLVNNAQREHQEFMDGVDAVARENGSAIDALPADGTAVYPADDACTPLWQAMTGGRRRLTFAIDVKADVTGDAQWRKDAAGDHWSVALSTPAGEATLRLHLAGRHNVKNALAAAACALAVGCPLEAITRGLASFTPVKGRGQLKTFQRGGRSVALIDDSYNANPDSVRAAIDLLADMPAPRWLVLGDMGEVGDQGPAFHAEVGAYAKERGIDSLWTAGMASTHAAAAFAGARHFDDVESLLTALPHAPDCSAVVVKGSRFMGMERVVDALIATEEQAAAQPMEEGTALGVRQPGVPHAA